MNAPLIQVQGARTSRRPGVLARVVRVVSGYALLHWLVRMIGYLLGWRYRTHLELADNVLAVRHQLSWLGRTLHDRALVVPLVAVDVVEREIRYPVLRTLLGLIVAAAGLLLGFIVAAYGFRARDWSLVGLAAGIALLGALLDIAIDVWVPTDKGTVTLFVKSKKRLLGVRNVLIQEADRFVMEFYKRVPAPK